MHTIKTIKHKGKTFECCIDGVNCSIHCKHCVPRAIIGTCKIFKSVYNLLAHPACLAPGIDTGPVEHGSVKVGETYWMLTNLISTPVSKIEIHEIKNDGVGSCGFKFSGFNRYKIAGIERSGVYVLHDFEEIFNAEREALERAAETLDEKLKEIQEKLKIIGGTS